MKQFKFDVGDKQENIEQMLDALEEYAKGTDMDVPSIIYNLDVHLRSLPDSFRGSYQDLVMLEVLSNMEDMAREDVRDWQMGDIYVAGDVGDIDKKIREALDREWNADAERR